jgi:hypothetical protein
LTTSLASAGYNEGMARRILLLLFRLLLVAAAYVAAFASFWQNPMPDRLFAIIPGTSLGLLLFWIKREQVTRALFVAVTTLGGALIPLLVPHVDHNWEEPWRDILSTTFGGAIGGLLGIGYIAIREAYERREPEMNANEHEWF